MKRDLNILITSFKGTKNSFSILLRNIHSIKSVDKLELTNSFYTSGKELESKLCFGYDYIISFGQKNICR